MDMGTGVAIFGVCGTIIAAILKWPINGRQNGFVAKAVCDERSAHILSVVERLEKNQGRIFELLDDLRGNKR